MTVTDQIKTIDNKIKANQVQCDLDRLTAKISVLSSGKLRKYEYLTGEFWDIDQMCLSKQNLVILRSAKLLIRDWMIR